LKAKAKKDAEAKEAADLERAKHNAHDAQDLFCARALAYWIKRSGDWNALVLIREMQPRCSLVLVHATMTEQIVLATSGCWFEHFRRSSMRFMVLDGFGAWLLLFGPSQYNFYCLPL